eukprot:2224716-Prymnesium_polylepis.3
MAPRSWMSSQGVKFATLDDVVIAGAARRLNVAFQDANLVDFVCYTARPCRCSLMGKSHRDPGLAKRPVQQWSSFYRPLVTRSMCIEHVGLGVPECPNYGAVFIRDFGMRFAPSAAALHGLKRASDSAASQGGERTVVNVSNAQEMLRVAAAKQCLWDMTEPMLAPVNPCKRLRPQQCNHLYMAGLK